METYMKLKLYIDDKGVKQSAISRKTGIHVKSLNAILNGHVALKVDSLIAICEKGLGTPVSDFFNYKVQ